MPLYEDGDLHAARDTPHLENNGPSGLYLCIWEI
jgi:hypothetical protein